METVIAMVSEARQTSPASNSLVSRRIWKDFHPLEHIEGSLPKPGIQVVFHNRCKSCSLGFVVKMTDAKMLRNDVAHLGDHFIAFELSSCELGRGGVFAHDAIGDFVVWEEIAVRQAGIALVGKDDFNRSMGMATDDRAILQKVGVMDRI